VLKILKVDKRVELLSIVFKMAENKEYNEVITTKSRDAAFMKLANWKKDFYAVAIIALERPY
jgi:hypothetical protein